MLFRGARLLGATVVASGAISAVAMAAAGPPPPPKSTNGNPVQTVATGLATPTAFAFGAGKVFVTDAGDQEGNSGKLGGVFVISHGVATKLPGSPPIAFGTTWHKGTLYVSALNKILAWSGWNGTKFTKQKTLVAMSKKFPGFNGLAFGPDNRLYAGVDVGNNNDHGPAKAPYQYDILSFNSAGKDLKIFAKGMRQPWQLAFPTGSSSPFVSDLGQDAGAKNAPDFVLRVRKGDDYGFPKCNWTKPKACKKFAVPFKQFAPHTDVMGLGIAGKRLYMSEFGGGSAPQVVSLPISGGAVKPLLTGFVAPIVGLGTHNGWVYVGELTGQAFRVKVS
jgi:glucose/arabinose dehydrogenase